MFRRTVGGVACGSDRRVVISLGWVLEGNFEEGG